MIDYREQAAEWRREAQILREQVERLTRDVAIPRSVRAADPPWHRSCFICGALADCRHREMTDTAFDSQRKGAIPASADALPATSEAQRKESGHVG